MMYLTIARKDILYFIYIQLYPHFSSFVAGAVWCCVDNAIYGTFLFSAIGRQNVTIAVWTITTMASLSCITLTLALMS